MRFGIAHVSPTYNQGANVLTAGASAIAALGVSTIKLWLSGNYNGAEYAPRPDYSGQVWGSTPTNLTQLAQTTPFAATFARAEFTRYFLGTWTFSNGIFDPWKGDAPSSMLASEYTEIYNLCVHLLSTYSGKDFLIQTAESDWALINNNNQPAFSPTNAINLRLVDRCVAFYGTRIRAIADARKAVNSSSRVFSAIEVNRVLDGGVRVHTHVLPRLQPDLISWTSYEAINDWTLVGATQSSVELGIETKMREVVTRIRNAIKATQGDSAERIPIIVGEFGWPEIHPLFVNGTFDAGLLTNKVVSVATALGITECKHWVLWDNEIYTDPPPDHPRRQCIYDENGTLSDQGAAIVALI